MSDLTTGQDWTIACVIATEVPPEPTGTFTADMIPLAIRAVCDVVRNRVADARFPKSPVEVVLQRGQFSAVCGQDYWRRAMAGLWEPAHVTRCMDAWREPIWPHFNQRMCWYFSPVSMIPPNSSPVWAAGRTEVLIPSIDRNFFRFFED